MPAMTKARYKRSGEKIQNGCIHLGTSVSRARRYADLSQGVHEQIDVVIEQLQIVGHASSHRQPRAA